MPNNSIGLPPVGPEGLTWPDMPPGKPYKPKPRNFFAAILDALKTLQDHKNQVRSSKRKDRYSNRTKLKPSKSNKPVEIDRSFYPDRNPGYIGPKTDKGRIIPYPGT